MRQEHATFGRGSAGPLLALVLVVLALASAALADVNVGSPTYTPGSHLYCPLTKRPAHHTPLSFCSQFGEASCCSNETAASIGTLLGLDDLSFEHCPACTLILSRILCGLHCSPDQNSFVELNVTFGRQQQQEEDRKFRDPFGDTRNIQKLSADAEWPSSGSSSSGGGGGDYDWGDSSEDAGFQYDRSHDDNIVFGRQQDEESRKSSEGPSGDDALGYRRDSRQRADAISGRSSASAQQRRLPTGSEDDGGGKGNSAGGQPGDIPSSSSATSASEPEPDAPPAQHSAFNPHRHHTEGEDDEDQQQHQSEDTGHPAMLFSNERESKRSPARRQAASRAASPTQQQKERAPTATATATADDDDDGSARGHHSKASKRDLADLIEANDAILDSLKLHVQGTNSVATSNRQGSWTTAGKGKGGRSRGRAKQRVRMPSFGVFRVCESFCNDYYAMCAERSKTDRYSSPASFCAQNIMSAMSGGNFTLDPHRYNLQVVIVKDKTQGCFSAEVPACCNCKSKVIGNIPVYDNPWRILCLVIGGFGLIMLFILGVWRYRAGDFDNCSRRAAPPAISQRDVHQAPIAHPVHREHQEPLLRDNPQ